MKSLGTEFTGCKVLLQVNLTVEWRLTLTWEAVEL